MTDPRWSDTELDVQAAVRHFAQAIAIIEASPLDGDDAYIAQMAFMHAMQSGHTSMEKVLVRILDLVGEQRPTGEQWHADLIQCVARAHEGRPAIVSSDLARAALETRKFRHQAMDAYDDSHMRLLNRPPMPRHGLRQVWSPRSPRFAASSTRTERQAMHPQFLLGAAIAVCALAGCAGALPVSRFAGDGPVFDPVTFWTGHTRSWGVIENRSGAPSDIVRTDCVGEIEGADGLHMRQRLTLGDGTVQNREWHMRHTGPGRFEATANDMVGTAMGEAAGRAFHWSWVLATSPGDSLRDVTMDQWMYLEDGGAMVNRTTIRKVGIILAEVTEQFQRVP